jgi:hypothetical protein
MRSTRRRNWILKRIVLGFAVVALVAPGAAKARVDEVGNVQAKSFVPFSTDFPKYKSSIEVGGTPVGMPHAGLNDYLKARDGIEIARLNSRESSLRSNDMIENMRLSPRGDSTQVVSSPGFDWKDAGIGAGLALVLLGLGVGALRATRQLGRPQTA